jgi:hypothetical protein
MVGNVMLFIEEDETANGAEGIKNENQPASSDVLTQGNQAELDQSHFESSSMNFRRRSSIKGFNPDDIPLKNKKSCWKQLPKANLSHVRSLYAVDTPAANLNDATEPSKVRFHEILIRSYDQTVGDNPCVSYGPPISLDWTFEDLEPIDVELYEASRGRRRGLREMMMNYYIRCNVLEHHFGASTEELKAATNQANRIKRSRALTKAFLPLQKVEEIIQSLGRKTRRIACRRSSTTF